MKSFSRFRLVSATLALSLLCAAGGVHAESPSAPPPGAIRNPESEAPPEQPAPETTTRPGGCLSDIMKTAPMPPAPGAGPKASESLSSL